eukprot:TRINITY_DN9447_c0_g1_i1.p1 TRINITY_DN9447_c0_g1~~TRINITY_DN9447_c0_g1_i1.p1  ORF type:complete len:188 (-),score=31.53 TRINITY_DN9447_c0_g1_i1:337-900(-)
MQETDTMTIIQSPALPTIELWFDSADVQLWDNRLEEVEDTCELEVHAGSCHRMNLKYWQRLHEVMYLYGAKVAGVRVRQLKGYLHPDAVTLLSKMLPQDLLALDLSRTLPGAAGLRRLAEYLPQNLQILSVDGCVDDDYAFAAALIHVLSRCRSLRYVSNVSSSRVDAKLQSLVQQAAPEHCEVCMT